MAGLSVVQSNPGSLQMGIANAGSLQGTSPNLQGSSPNLQSSYNPQTTSAPVGSLTSSSGSSIPAAVTGGGSSPTTSGTPAVVVPGMNSFLGASNLGISQLQGQAGAIPALAAVASNDVGNQANTQISTLGHQYQEGQAANQASQTSLNQNNAVSLAQLGTQLRALYQQTMDALGAQGAGNSSAAELLGTGLSQEANAGRQAIDVQREQQQTGINQNNANLSTNYGDQVKAVNDWKATTLHQLAAQYAAQKQNIEQEILAAGTDQARMGLYMRDQQEAQQALANMRTVVANAGSAIQQLNQTYSQTAPSTSQVPGLSAYDNGYQVQQFTAPQMPGISYGQNQAAPSAVSLAPIAAQVTNTGTNLPGTLQSLTTP